MKDEMMKTENRLKKVICYRLNENASEQILQCLAASMMGKVNGGGRLKQKI